MHKLTIFPTITREHRSPERYLSELKHIPLITAEEELQLARRIRAGDRAAVERLRFGLADGPVCTAGAVATGAGVVEIADKGTAVQGNLPG